MWTLELMLDLNDLRLFVHAVEAGGFAAASRRLGIPKSTLSKRLAALEQDLGARLVQRTTRSFVLTELGRDVFDHARAALIEAESAEAVVRRRQAEPSGTVRLTASVPVAQYQLAPRLPALALAHPRILLEIHATDRFVDIVQEGFDIAVRSHFAPLPDSGLVQRRVATEPLVLVAAPAYAEGRGLPEDPPALIGHDGLLAGPRAMSWALGGPDGGRADAAPRPRLVADESTVLLEAARAGLGIACLPESFCRTDLAAGHLVRVLPGWTAGSVTTTILLPHRRGLLPAVRAVVDLLAAQLDD